MAEKNDAAATEKKQGGGFKTILVVGGMLLVEAVLILGAVMMFGQPETVQASDVMTAQADEEEKIVEVLVLDDRLPNSRQGINYVYDTEIWVHVKQKNQKDVSDELNRFRNEIKAEIMAIWRTAEPRHLQEPRMENLTRKVHALLDRRFGDDPDGESPVIQKTVIVSGPGFRIDS